jgi:hypothetical protein
LEFSYFGISWNFECIIEGMNFTTNTVPMINWKEVIVSVDLYVGVLQCCKKFHVGIKVAVFNFFGLS